MYNLELNEVFKALNSSEKGLSEQEALRRLSKYGKNKVEAEKKKTLLNIIADQFKNTILWLLLFASLISFAIGEEIEGIGILLAVLISVGFGTYLEYKADKSLEKLKKLTEKKVIVLRDGKPKLIPSELLVPGDVIIVEAGSYIGGDAIVIESNSLKVDESHLTGESLAVAKRRGKTKKNTPLAERFNMLFAGSYAVDGNGKAVVIHTGKNTELGQIAKGLGEIESNETPLMKNLNKMGEQISLLSVALVIIVFLIGYFQERELFDLFVYSITLAVAAVPEGLTAVLTIMLTLSVLYMAKKNALVKKISSVETIGNVDLICVDKTGTITEGKLGLVFIHSNGKLYSIGEYKIDETLKLAALANSAKKDKEYIGDDVDVAIMRAFEELGGNVDKLRKEYGLKKINPFSSEEKMMSASLKKYELAIKGAYEVIIEKSDYYKGKKLDSKAKDKITKEIDELAGKGYRIIGVAYKSKGKVFLSGFLAFLDKEKPMVRKAIEELKQAGIKMLMLTGDNIKTAKAVAERVGIKGKALLWKDLEDKDKESLYKSIRNAGVIARSTPKSKLRIVDATTEKGHIIGMTGDGINDALALKKAHVGVVMGKKGSDISKEVADLILLDDNFYTMVNAIRYGRNLIKNIINFIRFQFTANISALMLTLSSLIMSIPFPLTPLQILWINIIMDGPPALSLGFEKPGKDIMKQKPRKGKEILSKGLILNILISSLYIALVVFYIFYSNMGNLEKALSMSFNTFVFFQLFNSLNCRSIKDPFYKSLLENKVLIAVVFIMAIIQISINQIPIFNQLLDTSPLEAYEWVKIFVLSSTILLVEEFKKKIGVLTNV